MEELLLACFNNEREADDEDGIEVWFVMGDGFELKYWNSSNSQDIDHDAFLLSFVDLYEDEGLDSTNSLCDGWNEIMFELKEIW